MSTLRVDTLQTTGGAGLYPAKAWVNFNGTGSVAIREDANVSSITDGGTGTYTTNFSNSMSSANYSLTGFGAMDAVNVPYVLMSMPSNYFISSSSVQTFTVNSASFQYRDSPLACVQVVNS
jgi:hypothetical protein